MNILLYSEMLLRTHIHSGIASIKVYSLLWMMTYDVSLSLLSPFDFEFILEDLPPVGMNLRYALTSHFTKVLQRVPQKRESAADKTVTMKFYSGILLLLAAAPPTYGFAPAPRPAFTSALAAEAATKFDLNSYLLSKKGPIEEALQASIGPIEPETEKICESMLYSLMAGGKRIRPVLCLAAGEMFGGTEEQCMPAAVALEMIHTMSLIHDDLPSMDNDDLRRGKPTNHVIYGEDVAILAGDALLSDSFRHVAEKTKNVAPERILDVVVRLGRSVGPKGLAGGQVMDLECEGKPVDDVTLDDLRWIHTHKTATLLQVAVASGAILGGASPDEVKACEDFALNIGLAFQVADDILDVTASTEDLGKTAGKDEDTEKTTYPRLLGLDGARQEAERLITEAKKCLEPFGERAAPLLAIADYIIDRKN